MVSQAFHQLRPNVSGSRKNVGNKVCALPVSRRDMMVDTAALLALQSVIDPPSSSAEMLAEVESKPLTIEDVTPKIAPAGKLSQPELAIIDVFEKSTYSVVNIFDLSLQGAGGGQAVDVPEGNGTGFVWDTEGHIVTNYHVLANILKGIGAGSNQRSSQGVKVARVTLLGKDGIKKDYFATLAGMMKNRDLVVLKINASPSDLVPIERGQSSDVRVGQQCLAIGNPFGFDHTLTTGAVSGLNRVIQSQVGSSIPGGIQTDAAINPGNSGGPLMNSLGRVIGVNTAIFTNSGTSAGVGFAIPIDTVNKVVPELIKFGKVVSPSLGVNFASPQVARALKVGEGVLVQTVDSSAAAAKAGLLGTRRGISGIVPGDVIMSVNTRAVKLPGDVDLALDQLSVGDTVTLRVRRGIDQAQDMDITFKLDQEKA